MTKTGIKKVLILGIDAIEYDLVEKWDLKNLKQVEYGKTELPLLPGQEPATVVIWPCFITGKNPKEMGYSTIIVYKFPIKYLIEIFLPPIRKIFLSKKEKNKLDKSRNPRRKLLEFIGILLLKMNMAKSPDRKDIKATTIFDGSLKSIHKHVPVLDEDAFPSYRKKIVQAVGNSLDRSILELNYMQEFKQRSNEVFDWIGKNEDTQLFMQYFFLLDSVQHTFYNSPKKIAKYYIIFDNFVKKIREKIDDETLVLIVSDHGQKKGIHTYYGFYSTNRVLKLRNPGIIDFKNIIEKMLL
jgi:predicted AlkP superfamily phosphohydrolase/phosphomutase